MAFPIFHSLSVDESQSKMCSKFVCRPERSIFINCCRKHIFHGDQMAMSDNVLTRTIRYNIKKIKKIKKKHDAFWQTTYRVLMLNDIAPIKEVTLLSLTKHF